MKICVIPGDGVAGEIAGEAVRALAAVKSLYSLPIGHVQVLPAGLPV